MSTFWSRFKKNKLGVIALAIFSLFFLLALYAPFFASSKPFAMRFEGQWYFPFFRYLFYRGFYTKGIDLFYNVLMFLFPLALCVIFFFQKKDLFPISSYCFTNHFFFSGLKWRCQRS